MSLALPLAAAMTEYMAPGGEGCVCVASRGSKSNEIHLDEVVGQATQLLRSTVVRR